MPERFTDDEVETLREAAKVLEALWDLDRARGLVSPSEGRYALGPKIRMMVEGG